MQPYIFQSLETAYTPSVQEVHELKQQPKAKSDPFMLQTTVFQPRVLFTQQDMDQSYKAGYIEAKSGSLKELQQEAEFQKIESLKMITDYFPSFIEQNQNQCKLFCDHLLQITQKIVSKLLPEEKLEKASEEIIRIFKDLINPLCQQQYLEIYLHPSMKEKVSDSISQAFNIKSPNMPIKFVAKEDFKISQCQIHWPEGMLTIDQTAFENNLQNLLSIESLGAVPVVSLDTPLS